jgi:hypothetical protein
MRKIIAVAVAASLTSCGTPPPPSATVTVTVAPPTRPASPNTPSPPPPAGLRPGPHSAIADVDLPAGTVPELSSSDSETEAWSYSAPYDDVVAFLQRQFATGRRYDAYGATSWNGLPPCYNDTKYNPADPAHESPPRGWVDFTGTEWRWSDGAATLNVLLRSPQVGKIFISIFNGSSGPTCDRA